MLVPALNEAQGANGLGLGLLDCGVVEFEYESTVEADDVIVVTGLGTFVQGDSRLAFERLLEQPRFTQGLHVAVDGRRADFWMGPPYFADQLLDLEMTFLGKGDG